MMHIIMGMSIFYHLWVLGETGIGETGIGETGIGETGNRRSRK
jgi:hypothetical protein